MNVVSRKTLREFWQQAGREDAEEPLKAWLQEAERANWKGPQDIKEYFGNASFLAGNRVVFNIGGNKYRLVISARYTWKALYVRFIGTHAEYDRIDASEV